MTGRILGRWALRLSRCPQASASATRLKAHAALPVEPLWSQTQIQTLVRPLCMGWKNAQMETPQVTFKPTNIYQLVENATTPQEVLDIWESQRSSANLAAICLMQMSKQVDENKLKADEILKDPRCVEMLKVVQVQVSNIWNNNQVALLRALCKLGVPPRSRVFESIQKEVMWRLRRFNVRTLSYIVDLAAGHPKYKNVNEVLTTSALKYLQLRWIELNDPKVIRDLMRHAACHSPLLMDKLEDKALELAEKFTAEDIRIVFGILASQRRRSVPLLRAFSYHLDHKLSSELKTPLLLNIAYTYGKLNFQHIPMIKRIAAELLDRLQGLSSSEVTQSSKSLAFLNWLHLPLFEGFAQHFLSNSQKYRPQELCNLLMSFAKLNFQPCNIEEFYKRVHEALEGSWKGLEPFLQTDLVWSLCVLQQAKPEHITAVTDPAFQTKLTGCITERTEGYRRKLLHIAASGQLESPGASSVWPTINLPAPQGNAHSLSDLKSSVHAALKSLNESCPTALRTDVNTVYGWTVDAELVVDSENKPIDLKDLVAPHLPGGGGSKQLPQGAHRMAFLFLEYHHFVSSSKELLGHFAMRKRHLQLVGFLVVEVPYFEWQELKNDWMHVAYLKDKIGKAVAENTAK